MHVAVSPLRVLLPLLVSWLMAASFPFLPSVSRWRMMSPDVPFLLTIPQPGDLPGHVRSSVYFFVIAAGAGIACALPLEISKFTVARRVTAIPLYVAFLIQQLVILLDVIRSSAWDWWLFLLSVARIRPIDQWSWMERHVSTIGRWPWPSAVSAILVAILFVIASRPRSHSPESR